MPKREIGNLAGFQLRQAKPRMKNNTSTLKDDWGKMGTSQLRKGRRMATSIHASLAPGISPAAAACPGHKAF